MEVRLRADKDAHTIIIEDTGVGMSKEELLSSLGTIARSGTAKFMEQMKEKHDANLIGQVRAKAGRLWTGGQLGPVPAESWHATASPVCQCAASAPCTTQAIVPKSFSILARAAT